MFLRRLAVPALVLPAVLSIAVPAWAAGGLAPGGTETVSIQLPRGWAQQATKLGVSVVDLSQSENGCLDPEVAAGDKTCGEDGGELAGQLVAEVAAGIPGASGGCEDAGTFVPLSLVDPRSQAVLSRTGAGCLVIRLTFRNSPENNVAQSDGLSFSVQTVAEGPDGGITPASPSSTGTTSDPVAQEAGNGPAVPAAGDRARGTAAGAAPAPAVAAGTAPTATGGSGDAVVGSGPVIGRQKTSVAVDGDSVAVQTEAASTSITGQLFAWGAMFLGVVLVGLAVLLWWGRRRREVSS
jgi:hypothetical protein